MEVIILQFLLKSLHNFTILIFLSLEILSFLNSNCFLKIVFIEIQ